MGHKGRGWVSGWSKTNQLTEWEMESRVNLMKEVMFYPLEHPTLPSLSFQKGEFIMGVYRKYRDKDGQPSGPWFVKYPYRMDKG